MDPQGQSPAERVLEPQQPHEPGSLWVNGQCPHACRPQCSPRSLATAITVGAAARPWLGVRGPGRRVPGEGESPGAASLPERVLRCEEGSLLPWGSCILRTEQRCTAGSLQQCGVAATQDFCGGLEAAPLLHSSCTGAEIGLVDREPAWSLSQCHPGDNNTGAWSKMNVNTKQGQVRLGTGVRHHDWDWHCASVAASNPTWPQLQIPQLHVPQLCPRSARDQASCTGLPTFQGHHHQSGEAVEGQ